MTEYESKLLELFSNGNDNHIDTVYLRDLFYFLGYGVNAEQLSFILDRNKFRKTSVTFSEVNRMVEGVDEIRAEDIFKAFAYYSRNDECEVNIKDLKEVLEKGRNGFTEDEIEEIVRHVECDYEGKFNYEMFVGKKLLGE